MKDNSSSLANQIKKRFLFKGAAYLLITIIGIISLTAILMFHEAIGITSSNAVLYFVKSENGFLTVTKDLSMEDANNLVFMLDINCLFSWLLHREASARGRTVLDVTWDNVAGRGEIKQFKPDGTVFSVTLGRKDNKVNGLFIGGELPYGDYDRSKDGETSGMSYYDGIKWNHIWCAANEGFTFDNKNIYSVYDWKYLSGRVLLRTLDEVMLESIHFLERDGNNVLMHRLLLVRAGDDYVTLHVKFENKGKFPIEYIYEYGDEPWVGKYGNSTGDVGWTQNGLVRYESIVSPSENRYAGYWDYGNDVIGERHNFSGYANFIEWLGPMPSFVYFSNDFVRCCSGEMPLKSIDNRIVNVVWLNQVLFPEESKIYKLKIGKAAFNKETGFPQPPSAEN